MGKLPYIVTLVKKNILIWSIVTTGSFGGVHFGHIKHKIYDNRTLQLYDFPLSSNDTFRCVSIFLRNGHTDIVLTDQNLKYLKNSEYYLGVDLFAGMPDTTKQNIMLNLNRYWDLPTFILAKDTSAEIRVKCGRYPAWGQSYTFEINFDYPKPHKSRTKNH